MFTSRRQLSRVCGILTRGCAREPIWGVEGPLPEAHALRADAQLRLGGGPRVLLELAFCLWEGGKGPAMGGVLELLDSAHLHLVGGLLLALSQDSAAIDRWVLHNGGAAGDA